MVGRSVEGCWMDGESDRMKGNGGLERVECGVE